MSRRRYNRPTTPPLEHVRTEYVGYAMVSEYIEADLGETVVHINGGRTYESFDEAVARVKAADGKPVDPARLPTRAEFEAMTAPRSRKERLFAKWLGFLKMWREAGIAEDFRRDGHPDPWRATWKALDLERDYLVGFKIYASKRRMMGHDLQSSRDAFMSYRTSDLSGQDRAMVKAAIEAMDEDEAFLPEAKALEKKEMAEIMEFAKTLADNRPMTPEQEYRFMQIRNEAEKAGSY